MSVDTLGYPYSNVEIDAQLVLEPASIAVHLFVESIYQVEHFFGVLSRLSALSRRTVSH